MTSWPEIARLKCSNNIMKILIVGLVKNYHFERLREEGEKQGFQIEGCYSDSLVITSDKDNFEAKLVDREFDYDLIYLWAFSKRRWEWITACDYLNKTKGTIIVNKKLIDPSYQYYLTPAIDYWKQKEAGLPFPKSVVFNSPKRLDYVLDNLNFPFILKPTEGRKGKNVFKVNSEKEAEDAIAQMEETNAYVARELIPNDGDIRVFTVGYKAIGAMKRTPKEGDFRSNISQGGSGAAYDLSQNPKVQEIAERLSETVQTQIAGVDIIVHKDTGEPYVLEINPGPQFEGLEKFTDINAAEEIVKYFKSLVN